MTPLPHLRRFTRLSVQPLEDRATPATALYTAATETLTLTAAQGDTLVVSSISGKPDGYLHIAETQSGNTVFDSSAAGRAVRSLIVQCGNVHSASLTLDATAYLGGSLVVGGATSALSVSVLGTVGGNITYTSPLTTGVLQTPVTATDIFDLAPTAVVGGNVTLALGGGPNQVYLRGGTVNGNLMLATGGGQDRLELMHDADVVVNGNVGFNLGNGTNTVIGTGTHVLKVGGNFAYTGGTGNDTIDLDSVGASIDAAGNARFTLGTPTGFDSNTVSLEALSARGISFVGGAGADAIEVSGAFTATGNVALNLGGGDNSFDSNRDGNGTNLIAGSFSYVGGQNGDSVQLDNTTIGRGVSINLGAALGGANAFVGMGLKNPNGVTVYGSMNISNAASANDAGILLARTSIGGNLTYTGGTGADNLVFDDLSVVGNTLLNTGAGNDILGLEQTTNDSAGGLGGTSTFGGSFTFNAGAGDDLALVTVNGSGVSGGPAAGSMADFGGHVAFVGGLGADQLTLNAGAKFEQPNNFTDFETVTGTLP